MPVSECYGTGVRVKVGEARNLLTGKEIGRLTTVFSGSIRQEMNKEIKQKNSLSI